ncbi:MAG: hypothetical protein SV062_12015 [Thermodesulfobacteriota bacterium]|nr:hypothetical protein [Thermodesulfobacteriota bacterium]
MKRTTVALADDLFIKLKKHSLEEGKTLKETINTLLRNSLSHPDQKGKVKLHWKTYKCGRSKVVLHNREALFAKMEE